MAVRTVENGNSRKRSTGHRRAAVEGTGDQTPAPPEPFGTYVEAVQTGNLLFLTGMLPTAGREAKFVGRSVPSSMWKRVARPLTSLRSMRSL